MNNTTYPVMESFSTLQGEGFHTGKAAWFIRLAGCDVGCVWCDVKESWTVAQEQVRTIDSILQETLPHKGKIVVITGGEPAMYDLAPLITTLQQNGFPVHIETSGAYPVKGTPDWITVSPKKFKPPVQQALDIADELKIVVFNKSDIDWAEQHKALVGANCQLYLQPEFSKHKSSVDLILEYIARAPEWKLSLQTHKFIGIP